MEASQTVTVKKTPEIENSEKRQNGSKINVHKPAKWTQTKWSWKTARQEVAQPQANVRESVVNKKVSKLHEITLDAVPSYVFSFFSIRIKKEFSL